MISRSPSCNLCAESAATVVAASQRISKELTNSRDVSWSFHFYQLCRQLLVSWQLEQVKDSTFPIEPAIQVSLSIIGKRQLQERPCRSALQPLVRTVLKPDGITEIIASYFRARICFKLVAVIWKKSTGQNQCCAKQTK